MWAIIKEASTKSASSSGGSRLFGQGGGAGHY